VHATPNGIARNFDGSPLPEYDAAHSAIWMRCREAYLGRDDSRGPRLSDDACGMPRFEVDARSDDYQAALASAGYAASAMMEECEAAVAAWHDGAHEEALSIDMEREVAREKRAARIARKRIRFDREARAEYQEAQARAAFDRLPPSVQVYELDREAREAHIALRSARNANACEYDSTMREAF
jgi:hypothetical protein